MSRRRAATAAEKILWSTAMQGVRKLAPTVATTAPAQPFDPVPPDPPNILSRPTPQPVISTPRMPGAVDGATIERLRRGQVMIEARIDLHGLDQKQAFESLMSFIDLSARKGRRALLVITGKGSAGQGGGVLRRNVPIWLRSSSVATRILTIVPAHTRHGGEGALYVLLRRERR